MTPAQITERGRRAKQAQEFMSEEIDIIRAEIHMELESYMTADDAYRAGIQLSALSEIEQRLISAIEEPDYQKSIT